LYCCPTIFATQIVDAEEAYKARKRQEQTLIGVSGPFVLNQTDTYCRYRLRMETVAHVQPSSQKGDEMKKFLIGLAAAALLSLQPIASHAVLFGVVNPVASGEPFFFNNTTATFGVSPGALPVEFTFLVANSCAPIGTPIAATLTIGATGTTFAAGDQSVAAHAFSIISNVGSMNLLSGTALTAELTQSVPNTAALTASAIANGLAFTSDCLAFVPGTEAGTFSFSSTSPDVFAPGVNPLLLQDTTFGGNGNFSAEIVQVPEPGVTGLLFSSCIGGGLLFARRRRAGTRK
jgi:hypothetical protein